VEVLPRRRVAAIGTFEPAELAALEPPLEPVLFARDRDAASVHWGGAVAPSLDAFLLDGLPGRRLPAACVLALRTARLLRSARRVRRGRDPRVAREFLHALASSRRWPSPATARGAGNERFRRAASALAARALGLRVRPVTSPAPTLDM
jgi:hypothetical protein